MNDREKLELSDILIQLNQVDYASIINRLITIISFYTCNKIIKAYHLHKEFKQENNISMVSLPPELTREYSDIDIEKIASQCFGDAVIEFAKLVMAKFPSENLTNFYNNLNELKIAPKNFKLKNLLLKTETYGTYDAENNQIDIECNNYTAAIYHELFHMASSMYKNGIRYSGFRQTSVKPGLTDLGRALNEGYTQLLTERYFGNKERIIKAYKFEVHITDKLEKIVGQEKMEELYLKANLPGLINELKKYITEEEIMKLISATDFLEKNLKDKKLLPFEKGMIMTSLKNVNEVLIKAYFIKLKKQWDIGTQNIDELLDKFATYILTLDISINIDKHVYNALPPETTQEILSTIFGAPDLTINIKDIAKESASIKF